MAKTIAELRAAKAKKIDALTAMVAKMGADEYIETAEDTAAYDTLRADIDRDEGKIKRQEEATRLAATVATPVERSRESRIILPARVKNSALKNFKGENAEERAYRFGQWAIATYLNSGSDKAEAAVGWCRENGILIAKAQGEGVNSAGGFLVPEEFSNEIIVLRDQYGIARRICKVWPMGRDTLTVPRLASGLTAYAVGESVSDTASAITKSQAAWDQVRLTAKKWGVLTFMSSELDEDAAVNIGDILVGEIAYAFANAEDTALFTGDGSATYHGIQGVNSVFETTVVGGASVLKGGVDAASGHDTMAEMDATDLAALQGRLPQYVYTRGNPTFYCSQAMWGNVFERLIGASGGVTKDQASGRTIREYNGYPVEITPAMPAPATVGTDTSDKVMILFGDLNMGVAMGDRRGMTVARSTDYKFGEDQVAIKGTERFDINPHGVGTATTAGPIVALLGE